MNKTAKKVCNVTLYCVTSYHKPSRQFYQNCQKLRDRNMKGERLDLLSNFLLTQNSGKKTLQYLLVFMKENQILGFAYKRQGQVILRKVTKY